MKRALFHIAIALSVLYMPWYLTAVLIMSLAGVLGFFAEAFIWAIFVDIIYGSTVSLWGIPYVFSLGALLILPSIALIRSRVSW